jgi:hypothetical protein
MEAMYDRMDAVGKAILGVTIHARSVITTSSIRSSRKNITGCSRS